MSRQVAYHQTTGNETAGQNGASADLGADESGSVLSERDTALVTINLSRFHDSIEARRADAVQHARSVCDVEHIPSMAVLAAGSLSVRTSLGVVV